MTAETSILHPDADHTLEHHPDCDGLYFGHTTRVRHADHMVNAYCERCDWHGMSYSAGSTSAQHEADQHRHTTAGDGLCHGNCHTWTD